VLDRRRNDVRAAEELASRFARYLDLPVATSLDPFVP